jgi:hypothetical protein
MLALIGPAGAVGPGARVESMGARDPPGVWVTDGARGSFVMPSVGRAVRKVFLGQSISTSLTNDQSNGADLRR